LARATVDHSETEEMVLSGFITEEQARSHPLRNVITRSVGSDPGPLVDIWVLPQTAGECFLVCSDGLTGEVPDGDIGAILSYAADPAAAADILIDRALGAGGRDNVTVIVIDVSAEPGLVVDESTAPRADS
jgi:PPM family protein phosphatase